MDYCFELISSIGIVDDNFIEISCDLDKLDFCYGFFDGFSFSSYLNFNKYNINLLVGSLRLELDTITDTVIGLSGGINKNNFNSADLSFSEVSLPDFFDGAVNFKIHIIKKTGLNFVYEFEPKIVVDLNKKLVMIGKNCKFEETVRVCKNLYISLYKGEIVAVFIDVNKTN
jgi:hypothetical protein